MKAQNKPIELLIEHDPFEIGAQVSLASLLLQQERFNEALDLLLELVDWYKEGPNFGPRSVRFLLAEASEQCGQRNLAIEQLKIVAGKEFVLPEEEWTRSEASRKLEGQLEGDPSDKPLNCLVDRAKVSHLS